MIERYVFVKLKEEHATPAGRAEVAAETRRVLSGLDRIESFRVGIPADDRAEVWDLSIAVRFASLDDVAPYLRDPAHRAYVDEYLKPRMDVIKAWNFDLEAPRVA